MRTSERRIGVCRSSAIAREIAIAALSCLVTACGDAYDSSPSRSPATRASTVPAREPPIAEASCDPDDRVQVLPRTEDRTHALIRRILARRLTPRAMPDGEPSSPALFIGELVVSSRGRSSAVEALNRAISQGAGGTLPPHPPTRPRCSSVSVSFRSALREALPERVPHSFPAPELAAAIARASGGRMTAARAQSVIDSSLAQAFESAIERGYGVIPWLGLIYDQERTRNETLLYVAPLPELRSCGADSHPHLDAQAVDAILDRHSERCPSADRVADLIAQLPPWVKTGGESDLEPSPELPAVLAALVDTRVWYVPRWLTDPRHERPPSGIPFAQSDTHETWVFDDSQYPLPVSLCAGEYVQTCGSRRTTAHRFAASLLLSTDLFAATHRRDEDEVAFEQRFELSSEDWLRAAAQILALDPSAHVGATPYALQ